MKEKIIKIKPKNVYDICKFLDKNYFHAGYGGGLNVTNKIYNDGVSFRTIEHHFRKNSPAKYQIIIKYPRDFNKEELTKLEIMTGN